MNLFNEMAISRVPVLKEGKPVGLVSKHDIVTKIMINNNTLNFTEFESEKHTVLNNNVESIMSYPLKTLNPADNISQAIKLMDEHNMNSVLLTSDEETLKGIITKKDLLEPIAAISRKNEEQKRFIQLRGQTSEIDTHEKARIINVFETLLQKYENHIEEGHAFVYIKKHIGRLNKGKTRGVEMFYLRARVQTDLGTFVASTEEFGSIQTANEVVRLLDKQINTTIRRNL